MQKSNIVDVEVRTSGSPDLRCKIATAVAFAQLSFVRILLMVKLVHGCQMKVLLKVPPNSHAASDTEFA